MWQHGWRDQIWAQLENPEDPWDLIVIGGGITGAGILREASRAGLRVLLLEAGDFSSGTSSRSSKLVHGGFRYLRNMHIRLTYEAVRERERLLKQGRGLVTSLGFLLVSFPEDRIPSWVFGAGLAIYDLLALKWGHQYYDAAGLRMLCPPLSASNLKGGYRYIDAQTDDARLVLRILREAVREGGTALNYAKVESLLRARSGRVHGVVARDLDPEGGDRTVEIQARVVINATGAWADVLREQVGGRRHLRKLRGGHLVFPFEKLPLPRAVSLLHPSDGRPVFAFPWEGVTIVGTTDIVHDETLDRDPAISTDEAEYLLTALHKAFPDLNLTLDEVQCTFSGFRPVVDTGKANPSKESREHVIWRENGLLTVTGGKLTTFRVMAHDALRAVRRQLPGQPALGRHMRVLDKAPAESSLYTDLDPAARLRLIGRHGTEAPDVLSASDPEEYERIERSQALWAELRWAARAEGVVHLDDLLMRRVRLGLLLPRGGIPLLERIRAVVQPELAWDDARWEKEAQRYADLWRSSYFLPS
jgi:glycerol-3-phosphate dehydrogenase